VKDLRKMNISLLCKWWWLLENQNGIWQDIVQINYMKNKLISLIKHRQSDSPVWSDLLKIRHIYLKGREFVVNNGKKISFWLDPWLEGNPLCSMYPILYELCLNQDSTVHEVSVSGWVVPFKIILPPLIRNVWYELARKLNMVVLNGDDDKLVWKWTPNKKFSVKSVYMELTKHETGPNFSFLWKSKLPEKIKKSCGWLHKMQF
jgi:hypothetical protein